MAQTKVSLIKDGVIVVGHLHTNHGITTDHIGEGSNLYFTDARVMTSLGSISTHIIPDTDITYDLGSATNRFRDLYLSGNTIHLGGDTKISVNNDGEVEFKDSSDAPKRLKVREIDFVDDQGRNKRFKIDATSGRLATFDAVGTLTADKLDLSAMSTTDLAEGSNLYYTDARVGTYLTNNNYATQSYVQSQVSGLVASAPATLDTLNELAAALGDDPNFATTVSNQIGGKLSSSDSRIANWDTAYGWGNHASVGYLTTVGWNDVTGKPSTFTPSAHNHDDRYYTETESDARFLGIGAKAADSNLLDGLDSTEFARGRAAWQQLNFDSFKQPGLYQYDSIAAGGGTAPPDSSPHNFRTIEIGSENRYSQIALPWATDNMYFRKHNGSWGSWRTVIHDGNIGSQSVNYATSAGSASTADSSGYSSSLYRYDNRTISPSEYGSGRMTFGFTSFNNNNTAPWADFIHLRGYTDNSGGNDNLLVFSKSSPAMRIYSQTYGSSSAYSNYVDVITSANIGSQSVSYASNAGTLDGVDSSQFLRSDVDDTISGKPTFAKGSSGTLASRTGYSDFIGYNPSYGSYIGGRASNAAGYIYAGGYYSDGSTVHTLIHSGNIGSQSVSYANSAGNASSASSVAWSNVSSKPAGWLNNAVLIEEKAPGSTAFPSGFYQNYNGSGNPTGTWFNYINVRHSNTGNGHGYQLGMSYYDNNLWFRSYQGGTSPTFQSWETAIGSGGTNQTKSGYLQSNSSLRAPIFYDSNNTGYYVDPSGTSNFLGPLNIYDGDAAANPRISLGRSDSQRLYISVDDRVATIGHQQDEGSGEHSLEFYINSPTTSSTKVFYWKTNNGTLAYLDSAGFKSNVYYDRDNTAYFVDPTHTSYLNGLQIQSGNIWMHNSRTLSLSGDPDTFYPVVFPHDARHNIIQIRKHVHNYQTWDGRLAAEIHSWSSTWGGDQGYAYLAKNRYNNRQYIAKVSQSAGPNNYVIVWLRGARSYSVYTSPVDRVGTPYYSTTDLGGSNGSVSPTTTVNFDNIYWETNSNGEWVSNTKLVSNNSVQAPIFYDNNNTGYYLDPASTSNLNSVTASTLYGSDVYTTGGWFRNHTNNNGIYWSSTGWHLYPKNGNDFYIRSGSSSEVTLHFIRQDGTSWGYIHNDSNRNIGFLNYNRGWVSYTDVNGNHYATASSRAPIFYDSNNTSYYVNPDGTSYLLGLTVNGAIDNYGGINAYGGIFAVPNMTIDKTNTYGTGIDLTFSGSQSTGMLIRNNTGATTSAINFFYSSAPQGARGSITVSSTSTAYNTSSDYRLKENLVEITDGIQRVKLLQPKRFNFIGDDKTVDGFVAHEAQEVVPEAVTGVKDGLDHEGNPEYQGIDQAKLVPLLTAALQEAIAKIEDLESRLQAIENQ